MPTLSAVVITRNEAARLPACLASLVREPRVVTEIVVVDDGSTDQSAAIVRDYMAREPRITMVANPQSPKEIAHRARDAYRHYLRVAPNQPDTDEIIGRIHFGIKHMM